MNKNIALIILFILLSVILLFHFSIYFRIIPYDIVWAGKINSIEEMKRFEIVSITINTFIIITLFIKYKQLKQGIQNRVINFLIWCFVILFSLNTIGNLFAKTTLELILGTGLTLCSAYLCFIVVRKRK